MNTTARFVELLSLSTRQAGAVAKYLQGKVQVEAKLHEPTPEGQAITAVDLATQDLILLQLQEHFPDVAVDAEEDTPLAQAFVRSSSEQPLIVLDPVDGTYNYSRGSEEYAVMAGLIENERFSAAVIFYPTRDELYWATEEGCFVQCRDGKTERVVAVSSTKRPVERLLVSAHVSEAHRSALEPLSNRVDRCRCSAYDAPCVALGVAQGAVAENRADRRRAIALYLTLAAGGTVLMGNRLWQGEDPETIDPDQFPTISAFDEELARQMADAWAKV